VGLVAATPTVLLALVLLPEEIARSTMWAAALGLGVGGIVATAHAGRTMPVAKAALRWVVMAVVTAALLVGGITVAIPESWARGNFRQWIPVVAGLGLLLWLGGAIVERKLARRLPAITALIAGVAIASVALQSGHYLGAAASGNRVRAWNVYHYYLGSKYFEELGYHDLYAATVAADDEWIEKKKSLSKKERKRLRRERTLKDYSSVTKVRDMHDYRVKPRAEIVANYDRSVFTDARWEEFGLDARWIRTWLSPKIWPSVLTDLGYNPAPPWTVVGTPLSNLISLRSPAGWLIVNSDLPMYLFTLLVCLWAFGIRTTAAMVIWLHTIQFNEARWTGGFFQYDWLNSCVLALAFYRKGWYGTSGVALSWGAMTRVFPGFLVFPIFVKLLWNLARGGRDHRDDPDSVPWLPSGMGDGITDRIIRRAPRRRWAFATAFTMACAVLFMGSHLTGQGLKTWPTWVDKIGRHSGTHATTSTQRIGIERMVLHEPRPGRFWARVAGPRENLLELTEDKRNALKLVGFLVFIPALIRRRDEDTLTLMMFLTFLTVTLSRYYCSVWVMLFVLGQTSRDGPTAKSGLFAGSVLLGMAAWFYAPPDGRQRLAASAGQYFLVNYEAYAMFVLLCVGYLINDARDLMKSEADLP
jgi:hypothetical protein